MSGVTLKRTNSIRHEQGEKKDQLMQKEHQLSEAIEAGLDKKAQDADVPHLGEI